MLNFLRKIRLKEMNGRYFKYAIGEIVLVVVGILIALSINNWNEGRKQQRVLNNILLEIHGNLLQDTLNLQLTIEDAEQIIARLNYIEDHGSTLHIDTLANRISDLHWLSNWNPINSGYNKLTATGLEISLPRELQLSLDRIYTYFNWSANQNAAEDLTLYSLNKFRGYLIEVGFPLTDINDMIRNPKDKTVFKRIITDPEFIGILRNHEFNFKGQKQAYLRSKQSIVNLIQKLEVYFESKGINYKSNS
jgi:Family of unknown function (DUF6090)